MVGQQAHPAGAVGGASGSTVISGPSDPKSAEKKAQDDLKVDNGQPTTNIQVKGESSSFPLPDPDSAPNVGSDVKTLPPKVRVLAWRDSLFRKIFSDRIFFLYFCLGDTGPQHLESLQILIAFLDQIFFLCTLYMYLYIYLLTHSMC